MRGGGRGARESRLRPFGLAGAGILSVVLLLGACTSRQVYDAGLGWRQNECNRMVDAAERARCLETANKDYDGYSREKSRDSGNP